MVCHYAIVSTALGNTYFTYAKAQKMNLDYNLATYQWNEKKCLK